MRVCLVYDCLFPWTVGGAERWMRNVAESLADDGHEVTYITRVQWDPDVPPALRGVRIVAVAPAEELYDADGNRRIAQALRFGRGVLSHLLCHGRGYDVVHLSSAPYFGLLAAGVAQPLGRYRIVCDWHEVWSQRYWREYLGDRKGRIADLVQRAAAHVPQAAFCFSQLHARRLREAGLRSTPTVLRGEWAGPLDRPSPVAAEPLVVFAGRMIPAKHAPLVVDAIVAARRGVPRLRGVLFGAGPELEAVRARIAALDAGAFIEAPGFVEDTRVQDTLARAACLLLPSVREGYGMIVIEAASKGVPSVLVAAADNAATEHITPGVNGFVAPELSAAALADAVVAAVERGPALREATADWFAANARELSLQTSLQHVLEAYGGTAAHGPRL